MEDSMLQDEWQRRSDALTMALIDRINAEPKFRQDLIDNPDVALESAGFDDPIELLKRNIPMQLCAVSCGPTCTQTCNRTCTKTGTIKKTKKASF
jgi:hypothetical protein